MSQSTPNTFPLQKVPDELQSLIGSFGDVESIKAFSLTSNKYRGMLCQYIFKQVRFEGKQGDLSSELGAFLGDNGNEPTMAPERKKIDRATFVVKEDDQAQTDNQLVRRIIDSIKETERLRVLVLDVTELTPGQDPASQEAEFAQRFGELEELKVESLKLLSGESLPPIVISNCNKNILKALHGDHRFMVKLAHPSNLVAENSVMIQSLNKIDKLYFNTDVDEPGHPGLSQVRRALHAVKRDFDQIQWLGFYQAPTPRLFDYPSFNASVGHVIGLLNELKKLTHFAFTVYSENIKHCDLTTRYSEPITDDEKANFYSGLIDRIAVGVPHLQQVCIVTESESAIVYRGTRGEGVTDMTVQRLTLSTEKKHSEFPFGVASGKK